MRALQRSMLASLLVLCCAATPAPVHVLYAGSLVRVMERQIGPAFERRCRCSFQGEGRGSNAIANLILAGVRDPDVFISADTAALKRLMGTGKAPGMISAYASFATSRLVLGYSARSRFASRFAAAAAGRLTLPELLQTPGLRIGRTDPRLDPKGYRTLIAMRLEAKLTHDDRLVRVLEDAANQTLPEAQLLVRLENGDLDVAFLYSTESQSRHLTALELPAAANLGHPALARDYASTTVTVDGKTYRGAPIAYALTMLNAAANEQGAQNFVRYLLYGNGRVSLSESGVDFIHPIVTGDKRKGYRSAPVP